MPVLTKDGKGPNQIKLEKEGYVHKGTSTEKQIENLKYGDKIKINKGRMGFIDAIFQEFIDNNRSLILLNFLSKKVNVIVENNSLETYF